jgi:hypothetical protein
MDWFKPVRQPVRRAGAHSINQGREFVAVSPLSESLSTERSNHDVSRNKQ